jgi:hypothetical protein
LNYAKSREELIGYCRAIASHHGHGEGQNVVYEIPGLTAPIINYYLSPQTHEQAFAEADLELEWKEILVRPEEDSLYWKSFFENGPPSSL